MYKSDNLKQTDKETFTYTIDKNKDFKILQLTDLHLGFGFISRKKDNLALNAVTKIIHKAKPDMIQEILYFHFCQRRVRLITESRHTS